MNDTRTPVLLVSGLDAAAVDRTAQSIVVAGTVLVHHDLSLLADGVITRTLRSVDIDGEERTSITDLMLVHGCLGCTLREDLLPLLRRLHRRSNVETIIVALDPIMEPEAVSYAIDTVIVADMPGFLDDPAGADVRVRATITCVDEQTWLSDATGDIALSEAREGVVDDERTLAQVAVGQVAFADALVVTGCEPERRDAWESARLMAVLRRLAPSAPMTLELPERPITPLMATQLITAIGADSRRGRIDMPHDPLLRGTPPLEPDCGVQLVEFHADRPFHPERLHDAIDTLLEGVVSARGRLWLATQPDESLWLESAGGGLQVATSGRWLAAMTEVEREAESAERVAMAALRWNGEFGDRHSSLIVLVHSADPAEIQSALRRACLTDEEMSFGQQIWLAYPDPFGHFHADPCDESDDEAADVDSTVSSAQSHSPSQSGPDQRQERP